MIPIANPIAEPALFDTDCRQPGNAWLATNPNASAKRFPSHWTKFEADLEAGFDSRCGWWAVRIASGSVDHYHSKSDPACRHLVYEWNNFRHASASINSSKKNLGGKVLDPFDVQAGWFEVLLPSMQLVRTNQVPAQYQNQADFTLIRLNLQSGTKIRRIRKRYYDDYKNGRLSLHGLEDYAPLVAEAVNKLQNTGQLLP